MVHHPQLWPKRFAAIRYAPVAKRSFPQTGPEECDRRCSSMNLYGVTQRFARTGRTGRVQAEISRIPFVLGISAVACALRQILKQTSLSVKLCVRTQTSFRIEDLPFSHFLASSRHSIPIALFGPLTGYRGSWLAWAPGQPGRGRLSVGGRSLL